jgi:hypothetical protein
VAPLIDEAPVPHLAYLINAIGELISAVLDVHRRLAQREVTAVDVGAARHGQDSVKSVATNAPIPAFAADPQIEHPCPALPVSDGAGMLRHSSIAAESRARFY